MTDDIVEFIEAQMNADEAAATAAKPGQWTVDHSMTHGWRILDGPDSGTATLVAWSPGPVFSFSEDVLRSHATSDHIARHDPATVLADVVGKRAILAEVLSWRHAYIDGDTWLSCAQAVDPHDEDDTPGSGCADEKRAGGPCDCGLDRRRAMMLHALVAAHAGRPGFKEEWRPV